MKSLFQALAKRTWHGGCSTYFMWIPVWSGCLGLVKNRLFGCFQADIEGTSSSRDSFWCKHRQRTDSWEIRVRHQHIGNHVYVVRVDEI